MVLVSVTDPETEPRHFTKDGDRDVLISSKGSTNAAKSSPLRLEANGNDTTARLTRSQSRRKQRAVTWAAIVDDMEDQRLARDEERRLQQEVAQVEENVASGGSQSTVSTMQTKQKKALPASKPVRTTAVKSKAGRPKVTKSATAVVEHEQPPMAYVAEVTTRCEDGPTLQLTDVEIQAAQARSRHPTASE
ncbi:hypothetical protein PR002_g23283 [Phytophthora rubi]|uniref:Uncharacterized protein n=1 Tax=Phytophthora rubi TaxID=129364 RepID=A0A6A3IMR3_9STRA|nr:hypothetical protein PR002_g23283 [Phytophthora rubi]